MNNYTDIQLKQALAKMLPEDIYQPKGDDDICFSNASEKCHPDRRGYYVLDTELLHLCWLIDSNLSDQERLDYNGELLEYGHSKDNGRFALNGGFNAPWQQRTIALAKVKGVEIV